MSAPARTDPAWTRWLPAASAGMALAAWVIPDAVVTLVLADALAATAAALPEVSGVIDLGALPEGSPEDALALWATARLLQAQLTVFLGALALGLPAWVLLRVRADPPAVGTVGDRALPAR